MTAERHSTLPYRADIDGLRAIAVLAVMAFHAFPAWAPGGFAGVDIFFVISGYLITGIILKGLSEGGFAFGDFYARRVRRIFPALIVLLLVSAVAGRGLLLEDEYRSLTRHILAGAGFASNFLLWSESGYFDSAAQAKPLLHLWSLGVEEQFYLLWPLLLVWAWKRRRHPVLLPVLLGAASFAWSQYCLGGDPAGAFYSPLSRFWELMLGCALALLEARRGKLAHAAADGCSFLGLTLIALSQLFLREYQPFPGWRALLPCVGAFLLLSSGPDASVNRRLLANPLLAHIGRLSYPLYLFHWPLLSFAFIAQAGMVSPAVRWGLLAASWLCAAMVHACLEKPLRRQLWGARKAFGLVLCLSGAVCLGYGLLSVSFPSELIGGMTFRAYFQAPHASGQEHAKTPQDQAYLNYLARLKAEPNYVYRTIQDKVELGNTTYQPCFMDAKQTFGMFIAGIDRCAHILPGRKNILLIGDSHAADLFVVLSQAYPQYHFMLLSGGRCEPVSDAYYSMHPACRDLIRYAFHFALTQPVDAVILASWWHDGIDGLTADIARLKSANRKVILVGPPLEYSTEIFRIIARYDGSTGVQDYMNSRILTDCLRISALLRRLAVSYGVSFLDRIRYFCSGEDCPAFSPDGDLLIWDYGHLSVRGMRFLSDRLALQNVLPRIMESPQPLQLP